MEIIQGFNIAIQSQIYYLTSAKLKDKEYFEKQICTDMSNSYYWSDEWSEEFYVELAQAGFISTTHDTKDGLILLPELQDEYAILDFENLHISKKVKKIIERKNYEFCIDSRFNEVLEKISSHHKYNWLKEEYAQVLKNLHIHNNKERNFRVVSFELICKDTDKLIAGEVGYFIGKTYTSLSGFSSREKQYANYGTLQLVLLAKHLQNSGFEFWNFGHPHMEYKKKLGCITYSRSDFLKRWNSAI